MTRHFFAIFLFVLIASLSHAHAEDFAERFVPTKPPVRAPLFPFQDARSRTLDLRDFKGHYVLLNLWATWCGPCVREMAALDSLQQRIDGKTLSVVALSEDSNAIGAAEGFYQRHNLHHLPVFADVSGQAPSILHIEGLPTTLLIDPNGMEIGRVEGDAEWDDANTIAFLEKQMKRSLAAK